MSSITMFSTLAVRKALDETIIESFEGETGTTVERIYDPTVQLLRRVHCGETFDVMIGVTESLEELVEQEVVDAASRRPIARTCVGLAVAPGARHPDISDPASFVASLLAARSVAYSQTGASGIYFARLIRDLGIAEEINAKATIIEKGFIAEAVVDGRADIAVQQLSELMFVPGAEIVGPFPEAVQHYTEFSAARSAIAHNPRGADAFIASLTSEASTAAFALTGLQPADPVRPSSRKS